MRRNLVRPYACIAVYSINSAQTISVLMFITSVPHMFWRCHTAQWDTSLLFNTAAALPSEAATVHRDSLWKIWLSHSVFLGFLQDKAWIGWLAETILEDYTKSNISSYFFLCMKSITLLTVCMSFRKMIVEMVPKRDRECHHLTAWRMSDILGISTCLS